MATEFPIPLSVEPAISPHTHTCIFLHGLGSNGPFFGNELLAAKSSNGLTLQQTFPRMKFIFPTARRSRSTVFKRMKINQWFDVVSLPDETTQGSEGIDPDGLAETSSFIRGLIESEIESGIPAKRIILGGISQGYAASIYTLFTLHEPIGAYVGMSGYFPFMKEVEEILAPREFVGNAEIEDEVNIVFGDDSEDQEPEGDNNSGMNSAPLAISAQAINFLRENIGLTKLKINSSSSAKTRPAPLKIPIFLGHGSKDEKVHIVHGERAKDVLRSLEMDVTWYAYEDLGHWYQVPQEIDDIIAFIKQKVDGVCE